MIYITSTSIRGTSMIVNRISTYMVAWTHSLPSMHTGDAPKRCTNNPLSTLDCSGNVCPDRFDTRRTQKLCWASKHGTSIIQYSKVHHQKGMIRATYVTVKVTFPTKWLVPHTIIGTKLQSKHLGSNSKRYLVGIWLRAGFRAEASNLDHLYVIHKTHWAQPNKKRQSW